MDKRTNTYSHFCLPLVLAILAIFAMVIPEFAHAGTVAVIIRASPSSGLGPVAEAPLRAMSDQVESILMDWFFEDGRVVTSLPPLIIPRPAGQDPENHERAQALFDADHAQAETLLLVTVESSAPDPLGKVRVLSAKVELHPLGDTSLARGRALRFSPGNLGELAGSLGSFLKDELQ